MNRFQRSWQLFKSSLEVMRRDTRLLVFPLITAVCTGFVAVLFLTPVAFQNTGYSYTSAAHWEAVGQSVGAVVNGNTTASGQNHSSQLSTRAAPRALGVAYFAVMYFVSMFVATFFNVAFYQQILNALHGGRVSIRDGLGFAASKWKPILMWILFAGLVGYVIKTLEERFGFIGQWVMRLLGTAWSIACVFVIPVIITDEQATSPLLVLKRSALTLKQTWGESLIGYVGVSFGSAIIFVVSLLWLGAGVGIALALKLYWLIAIWALVWLVAIILFSYVMGVASQIFRCALFVYATEGKLPEPYTDEMLALAWKTKKNRE